MKLARLAAIVVGGIAGSMLGFAAATWGYDVLMRAPKEDFTGGLIAIALGAPAGTLLGVFLAGVCCDRLFSARPPR